MLQPHVADEGKHLWTRLIGVSGSWVSLFSPSPAAASRYLAMLFLSSESQGGASEAGDMLERNKNNSFGSQCKLLASLFCFLLSCFFAPLSSYDIFFFFIFFARMFYSSDRSHSSSNTTCFDSLKCVLMWLWDSPMPVFRRILENKRWNQTSLPTWSALIPATQRPHLLPVVAWAHLPLPTPNLPYPIPPHPAQLHKPAGRWCLGVHDCPRCGFESNGTLESPLLSGRRSLPPPRSHPINCTFTH